jgi:hypothetical protein
MDAGLTKTLVYQMYRRRRVSLIENTESHAVLFTNRAILCCSSPWAQSVSQKASCATISLNFCVRSSETKRACIIEGPSSGTDYMCLPELPSYMNHRNMPTVAIRQIVKQWLENDKTFNQLDIQHRYTARSTGILVLNAYMKL